MESSHVHPAGGRQAADCRSAASPASLGGPGARQKSHPPGAGGGKAGSDCHMLGNREEAREVFQETFLKAYRSLSRFRFESSFYTWVYRIATNVSLDHLRKRQTLKEEISYESDTEMNPDRPALKETLAATTYYTNPERCLYGK